MLLTDINFVGFSTKLRRFWLHSPNPPVNDQFTFATFFSPESHRRSDSAKLTTAFGSYSSISRTSARLLRVSKTSRASWRCSILLT